MLSFQIPEILRLQIIKILPFQIIVTDIIILLIFTDAEEDASITRGEILEQVGTDSFPSSTATSREGSGIKQATYRNAITVTKVKKSREGPEVKSR
jgi:hypothetical protein